MAELDMNLERVLSEHKFRRRSFLAKMVLAPAAISSTGLLVNVMAVGKAWGQTAPVTTIVTFPVTTIVTFPVTTLVTQPVTFPVTTLFTFPITEFTLPVSDPVSNAVPEPSSALLVTTGIAAAIAISARYRAAAERRPVAAIDLESPDRLGE